MGAFALIPSNGRTTAVGETPRPFGRYRCGGGSKNFADFLRKSFLVKIFAYCPPGALRGPSRGATWHVASQWALTRHWRIRSRWSLPPWRSLEWIDIRFSLFLSIDYIPLSTVLVIAKSSCEGALLRIFAIS